MTTSTLRPERAAAVARQLRASMRGTVLTGADARYDAARRIWNGAVGHRPALIARCADGQDVMTAVRAAREHGLPLSVRGRGHDWAGRALRHDGLVLDLSAMRGVTVDPATRTAVAAGGATVGDVVAAAASCARPCAAPWWPPPTRPTTPRGRSGTARSGTARP